MCILREKKLLYIHIPKTGGTSIEKLFLQENGSDLEQYPKFNPDVLTGINKKGKTLNHLKLGEYKEFVDISEYFIFTVFRNPIDRLVSSFNFQNYIRRQNNSFDFYLDLVEEMNIQKLNTNKYNYLYVEPQINYFKGYKIDKIIKFHNLNDEMKNICERFNFKNSLKHHNVSRKAITTENLTQEQKDRIRKIYAEDFFIYDKL